MALRYQQSDWVVDEGTLKKQIGYLGLTGANGEIILQIHVDTTPNDLVGGYNRHVCILMHPNPLHSDPGFVPAQLARDDKPLDSEIILVRCGPCANGSLLIQPVDRQGADAFLATLSQCVMMRLVLFDDTGAFLKLPIPNDEQYRLAADAYFSAANRSSLEEGMFGMHRKPQGVVSRVASKLFG